MSKVSNNHKPAMNRRTALSAAAVAPALAMPAMASPTDPIVPLYREWKQKRDKWVRLAEIDDWDAPHMCELHDRRHSLQAEISAMRATTMDGLICQIRILTIEHAHERLEGTDAAKEADWTCHALVPAPSAHLSHLPFESDGAFPA